jgi:gas vesicle protein
VKEETMADENNRITSGALMLIAGGIIGAGLALLFAPQSGKKTRRDINRIARKTKHKAEDMVDDFVDAVSDMAEVVGDKAADILDQGKELAHEAKKDLLRAMKTARKSWKSRGPGWRSLLADR